MGFSMNMTRTTFTISLKDPLNPLRGRIVQDIIPIFRNQKVRQATFELNASGNRMTILLACENGIRKQYSIPTTTDRMLIATMDRDSCQVYVTAEASKLVKILSTFHSNVSSIALKAYPSSDRSIPNHCLELRSHLEPGKLGEELLMQH